MSWGYEAEQPSASRFIDEHEWTGTHDPAAYLTVPAAIKFCEEHHWDEVRAQCHTLVQQVRERITELTGLPPISPDSADWYMQMVALPLPPCDPVRLKTRLYDEFKVEVPMVVWQGKPYIRVSIQAYNTQDDVDRLLDGLAQSLDA